MKVQRGISQDLSDATANKSMELRIPRVHLLLNISFSLVNYNHYFPLIKLIALFSGCKWFQSLLSRQRAKSGYNLFRLVSHLTLTILLFSHQRSNKRIVYHQQYTYLRQFPHLRMTSSRPIYSLTPDSIIGRL